MKHHGVIGMKWGHRKGGGSSETSPKSSAPTHASPDHIEVESHKSAIKQHGLKALSNEQLQKVNNRMNLEQQYRDLNNKKPNKFDTGHGQVKKIIAVGKTLNNIHNTVNSPLGKAAVKAAKAGVKAKTASSE